MFFIQSRKERKRFEEWLPNIINNKEKVELLNWREWLRNTKPLGADPHSQFRELIHEKAEGEQPHQLQLNDWGQELTLNGKGFKDPYHRELSLIGGRDTSISDFKFKKLYLRDLAHVRLTKVWTEHLELQNCQSVTLVNCYIGTLELSNIAAIGPFGAEGGGIYNMAIPNPSSGSPFISSVTFSDSVHFPRERGLILKTPQPYRNMRAHMLKLENTPMVSRFHTLEQAAERSMESSRFNRTISKAYELLSDYGSSPVRPVIWFCALLAVTGLAAFLSGSSHAADTELNGWQTSLAGSDCVAEALRALVLTGQSTLNPLGIFGTKGLVVAKSGWLALWLSVHGLLSTLLVALFIFAVRRRFKMS